MTDDEVITANIDARLKSEGLADKPKKAKKEKADAEGDAQSPDEAGGEEGPDGEA